MSEGCQPRIDEKDFTNVQCVECGKKFKFRNASTDYLEIIVYCSDACREEFYKKHHKEELKELELDGKKWI